MHTERFHLSRVNLGGYTRPRRIVYVVYASPTVKQHGRNRSIDDRSVCLGSIRPAPGGWAAYPGESWRRPVATALTREKACEAIVDHLRTVKYGRALLRRGGLDR